MSFVQVNYKKEFLEQKGHNIPVAETPDTVRVKNQQKFLSDVRPFFTFMSLPMSKTWAKSCKISCMPFTVAFLFNVAIPFNY